MLQIGNKKEEVKMTPYCEDNDSIKSTFIFLNFSGSNFRCHIPSSR